MKIVVIGAGLGGLAAGLRLAHEGHDVTILEKTDQVGGRNRLVKVNDCEFDGGPTLLMMLDPFRKLFQDVGERLEDHLDLQPCEPSYRVFYRDGTKIDATSNPTKMAALIETEKDKEGFKKLLYDLSVLYDQSIPNFVEKNFYSWRDFFGPRQLALVAKHHMLSNLAKRVERYVEDPRLRMLFSFQTMYLGLSPYEAPWVYATLAYMEYGQGIWYPKGGLPALSQCLADLAEKRGAQIKLESPVASIQNTTITLETGEKMEADAIVCNADLPYAEQALLKEPLKKRTHSCSALISYIDYEGSVPELLHHNILFGADFRQNLDQIFHKKEIPDDPAVYVCLSKRSDPQKAPQNHENLYVLTPCPNLDKDWSYTDLSVLSNKTLDRLKEETSFDPKNIKGIKTYTPQDWATDLNLDKGSAFGLSHHFRQSAYFRPSNRSRTNPKVYFVGASTTPGNGMPMVLISADLVVQRMKHDGLL